MICVPIVATTHAQAEQQLLACSQQPVQIVELRLDFLAEPPDLPRLLAACPRPAIVTCRSRQAGGQWDGSETDRLALLRRALELGASYIDVEAECARPFRGTPATKVIASYHNFDETPAALPQIVRDMEALPCDLVKFATMARSQDDNRRVLQILQGCTKPAIGLCMGEWGEISRILNLRYGSVLTFGSLEAGCESAPGQLTAVDLARLYRVPYLTDKTALYGVVGDPIAHSMSPEIHNTAINACGLDAVYLRFRVRDFGSFLADVAEPLDIRGLSVTIPHKDAARLAASEVDPTAERIGAVNTLTRTPTGWRGQNTDCEAALDAIRSAAARAGRPLAAARALLLGAGGTARAVGFGLARAGCRLTIANRTRTRAAELAADLDASVLSLEDLREPVWDVVANTTSVGMHPNVDASPAPPDLFRPAMVAFDAVYNPRETRMLRDARARGAAIADGLQMFVGQAVRQFEAWTGASAPVEAMEEVVQRRLAQT